MVPLFKKGHWRVCSNYRGITLLSLPSKVYSGVPEERVGQIVKPRIREEQCGFRLGLGPVDQLHTLSRVLEDAWEVAQPVHMCFVDLEKAFDLAVRSQMRWFGHLVRMPPRSPPGKMFKAQGPRKTQVGLEGLCISDSLETPRIPPRKSWATLLRLLLPRPDSG